MRDELQIAIAALVARYNGPPYGILNVAAAVEELSAVCPGVDKDRIAHTLRHYAMRQGVTMLLNAVRADVVSVV